MLPAAPADAATAARVHVDHGSHIGQISARGLAASVPLPDGFQPEGVASFGATLFVGSLADGRIWRADARTGLGAVLLPGQTGRSLRGLHVDARSGLLWAVGNEGSTGVVLGVDTRTGALRYRIEVPGSVFLNDLTPSRDGLWVTDSRVDRLTQVVLDRRGRPVVNPLRFVPLVGSWPDVPAGAISANGIRTLWDGSLLLDNSTAGGLWRVDPATGIAGAVPIAGGTLTGGDGLLIEGRTVYVVRGNDQASVSVLTLSLGRQGLTATFRGRVTNPALQVPSTATRVGGVLYAVNARFGVANPATASYALTRLPLRPNA